MHFLKAIYLLQVGLSIDLVGPAKSSVDVLVLNCAFFFEPPGSCACIFYFKVRLLLEAMQKVIDSLLKEDT